MPSDDKLSPAAAGVAHASGVVPSQSLDVIFECRCVIAKIQACYCTG